MAKRIALLMVLMLLVCQSALAATTKLTKYALVVSGKKVELSVDTGYVSKSGSVLMVPVEHIAGLFKLTSETKDGLVVMTGNDGSKVEIKPGSKTVIMDGRKMTMRVASARFSGKLLVDIRVLRALGLSFKHYPASKALRLIGYNSGAVAVALPSGSLKLPNASPEAALPEKLRTAAKGATQLVGVEYTGGSACKLALYELVDNNWKKTMSIGGYLGRNGIGKTKEGDKKTPTGTFALKTPFGIKDDPGTKMGGYLKLTKYHYWGGQMGGFYNRLVDTKLDDYAPNKLDEHLIDYKTVYNYCLLIDYNPAGTWNKGSAIFLHCQGSTKSTAGCVAIPEKNMVQLLKTLDSGAKIVIYAGESA